MNKIHICLAAHNEEKVIGKTLKYLKNSLDLLNLKEKPTILVCLNGCTDNTTQIVKKIKNNFGYPIRIIESKKGKLKAHEEITKKIKGNYFVLFMDADILVPPKTIKDLLNCIKKEKSLKIVSAYPYVIKPNNLRGFKKVLFSILNIKRIYPKIMISKNDVSEFHGKVEDKFLKKSRVYFHGRCFILKDKNIYKFPKKKSQIRGDDTYLSFYTLRKQPKNSIKVLYDSPVYSYPVFSVKEHLKVWYRIRKDLENIYLEYPDFIELGKKIKMIINWRYVLFELPLNYKFYAFGFYLLKKFESISYKLIKNRIKIDNIW